MKIHRTLPEIILLYTFLVKSIYPQFVVSRPLSRYHPWCRHLAGSSQIVARSLRVRCHFDRGFCAALCAIARSFTGCDLRERRKSEREREREGKVEWTGLSRSGTFGFSHFRLFAIRPLPLASCLGAFVGPAQHSLSSSLLEGSVLLLLARRHSDSCFCAAPNPLHHWLSWRNSPCDLTIDRTNAKVR